MEEQYDLAVVWSCRKGVESECACVDFPCLDSGGKERGGGWLLNGLGCAARDVGRVAGKGQSSYPDHGQRGATVCTHAVRLPQLTGRFGGRLALESVVGLVL